MTATRITNLKKSGVYGDADGLRLRVTKTGKKNWIFRYRLFGKNKDIEILVKEYFRTKELILAGISTRQARQIGREIEKLPA